MELTFPPIPEDKKFDVIMEILSFISPFNKLRKRDRQVLTGLYYANHKYKDIPEEKRNILIFDYDTRQEISERYGMSISSVYVSMMHLRKIGIITESSLVKKYIINDTNKIIFNISTIQ